MTDGDSNKGNADLPGNVVALLHRRHVINELDLVRLLAGHWKLDTLCDLLEACADALPTRPSLAQRRLIAHAWTRADLGCIALKRNTRPRKARGF